MINSDKNWDNLTQYLHGIPFSFKCISTLISHLYGVNSRERVDVTYSEFKTKQQYNNYKVPLNFDEISIATVPFLCFLIELYKPILFLTLLCITFYWLFAVGFFIKKTRQKENPLLIFCWSTVSYKDNFSSWKLNTDLLVYKLQWIGQNVIGYRILFRLERGTYTSHHSHQLTRVSCHSCGVVVCAILSLIKA